MDRRVTRLPTPDPEGGYTEIVYWPDGRRAYMECGDFHRLDGPAFIGIDGVRTWLVHGREHRTDGPAVEYPDGHVEYWEDGVYLGDTPPGKSARGDGSPRLPSKLWRRLRRRADQSKLRQEME